MLVKSISICNKYSLYNGDGEWKAAVKAVIRTLTGKCEKEHDKLIKDTRGWGAAGANKHKEIIQKLCQKAFKKKSYENQKDAICDGIHYQGNDHQEADFYRQIIPVMLHPTARVTFIKQGVRNLRRKWK